MKDIINIIIYAGIQRELKVHDLLDDKGMPLHLGTDLMEQDLLAIYKHLAKNTLDKEARAFVDYKEALTKFNDTVNSLLDEYRINSLALMTELYSLYLTQYHDTVTNTIYQPKTIRCKEEIKVQLKEDKEDNTNVIRDTVRASSMIYGMLHGEEQIRMEDQVPKWRRKK